ncbi:RNA polymerase sigma factor [Sedimenticola sp.]|uniref:RNA polymerase sigma factor n=1 Tax=Sedimenticola sp. TaxID=1940285 RepID=UPI003D0D61DE
MAEVSSNPLDREIKRWFSNRVEEMMGPLYSTALHMTRNRAEAEDLVADAVAKAWSAVSTLEDRSRFRPWVFRIMRNFYISHYRKKSRRPEETCYEESPGGYQKEEVASLLVEQPDNFLNWWANPEKEFVSNLLSEEITKAIDSLPEAYRATVLLINVDGFSYDEAAEVLNVSAGTIRSRMNRGRTLLQKALWHHANEAGLITDSSKLECST